MSDATADPTQPVEPEPGKKADPGWFHQITFKPRKGLDSTTLIRVTRKARDDRAESH
jgi:hypothetical protein